MSLFFYRVFLTGYKFLLTIASIFHPKARLWIKGREGLLDRLRADFPDRPAERPVVWFHAASLGEFEQGRPVIEAFSKSFPNHFILLTFFSPSGYEVRKDYKGADYICYLPLDSPRNAREFVDIVKPVMAYFIKYEFWYFYLEALRTSGVPVVSFSAIFRKDQLFFKPYGGFYRNLLLKFDAILVQNEESVALLQSIGVANVEMAGDTRYDRVFQIAASAHILPQIESFTAGTDCLVIGSAWPQDMEVIIPFLNSWKKPLKVIVAPHEIREREMAQWRRQLNMGSVLYSEYAASHFASDVIRNVHCLFIDNIGMLSSLYRYGSVAYIGGGFGAGLHNVLEAVTFGLPVLFGNKNYLKFQEAVDLSVAGIAFPVSDASELTNVLTTLLLDPEKRNDLGVSGRGFVTTQMGATDKVLQVTQALLAGSRSL